MKLNIDFNSKQEIKGTLVEIKTNKTLNETTLPTKGLHHECIKQFLEAVFKETNPHLLKLLVVKTGKESFLGERVGKTIATAFKIIIPKLEINFVEE